MLAKLKKLSLSRKLDEPSYTQAAALTIFVVCGAFLGFIIWAAITNISEVARADGEIVPEGLVLNVQHLEGGIVKSIKVNEGEIVRKEQLLMILDGAGINEELAKAKAKQLSLELQAERLHAFINSREPDYQRYEQQNPNLVRKQIAVYRGMLAARSSDQKVLHDQLQQQEHALNVLLSNKETLEKQIPIAQEIYNMMSSLNEKGYESKLRLLTEKQKIVGLRGKHDELVQQIAQAREAINEYQEKLRSYDAKYKEGALQQLEQIEDNITQNKEQIDKLQAASQRLLVRSPADGIVKSLSVNTLGEVVIPGATIMEIVPLDKQLIANIKIAPSDIGHIKIGQTVRLKISSYDYIRYGIAEGEIYYISATTFKDRSGVSYYKGLVRLQKNYLGSDASKNFIMPGMVVQADIVTGKKSILAYLLKPIQQSINSALTER